MGGGVGWTRGPRESHLEERRPARRGCRDPARRGSILPWIHRGWRPGFPLELHPGVAPDQPVVLVGEPMPVPLADSPDGVVQGGSHGVDGVEGVGVVGAWPRDRCGWRRWRGWSRGSRSASGRPTGGPPDSRLSMNSATSSAPKRIRADRVALDGRPDVMELVEFRADRQVIAEHPRMVDRPDCAEGDGPLQRGQGNIPVIDGQQAEIITHRPTPSPGFQRKRPSLARREDAGEGRRRMRRPGPRSRHAIENPSAE